MKYILKLIFIAGIILILETVGDFMEPNYLVAILMVSIILTDIIFIKLEKKLNHN